MRSFFRSALALPLFTLVFSLCVPARASSIDENLPDAQTLSQLELRAQQASPRDQCFLYTELVHIMTELAGKQLHDGDIDQASVTLKKINQYAQLIHMDLGSNSKRLKNAEMLLEHTTYRASCSGFQTLGITGTNGAPALRLTASTFALCAPVRPTCRKRAV
jgi:hypothetical protein